MGKKPLAQFPICFTAALLMVDVLVTAAESLVRKGSLCQKRHLTMFTSLYQRYEPLAPRNHSNGFSKFAAQFIDGHCDVLYSS
ncbi:hypothetical protein GE21DRAFT_1091231 [Neurospora crassa]|nr:hypothetical protein GE21DRAFT_1091231 [Neurospora crassa]